ncbi:hypothetical protein Tco_1247511 [Tanacetum coccineum]
MMEDLHGDFDNIEEENVTTTDSVMVKAKIHELIEDGLGNDWYTETPEDDDLDCLEDYLELHSNDNFINIEDEAYKESIYLIGQDERYVKVKVVEINEIPRTISNVAMVRAALMEEVDTDRGVQRATLPQLGKTREGQRSHISM